MSGKNERLWEIDFFRGLALVAMIYYHIVFDLETLFKYSISANSGFSGIMGKAGIAFIIISGISCSLSKNNFKRGLKLFVVAMIISIATYFVFCILFKSDSYVKFGVLHLISISIIASGIFYKLKPQASLIVGITIILLGSLFENASVSFDLFFPLGIKSDNFSSLDYFPLFPYSGFFLIGVFIGKILYKAKPPSSLINLLSFVKPNNQNTIALSNLRLRDSFINKAGQNSLLIYLIHQPIIITMLYLINLIL